MAETQGDVRRRTIGLDGFCLVNPAFGCRKNTSEDRFVLEVPVESTGSNAIAQV